MNQNCPVPPSKCFPCNPPLTNLSAEQPDQILFYGSSFNSQDPVLDPPVGVPFTSVGCLFECVSSVSQADADLCAQAQQIFCNTGSWKPPTHGGGPPSVFFNQQQSCAALCPDGSPFTFTVPAGKFSALSQALADRMAHSYACRQARLRRFCLPTLSPTGCKGQPFNVSITVSGAVITPCTWQVVAGSLPPGLTLGGFSPNIDTTLGPTETIQGTPTTSGSFTFTLQCSGQDGSFMQKQYTICVAAISPSTLPSGSTNVPYSQQLTDSSGCIGSPTWSVSSGTLPNGLSLSSSGLISGTPTQSGTFAFTATETSGSKRCDQNYTLVIAALPGILYMDAASYATFAALICPGPIPCITGPWTNQYNLSSGAPYFPPPGTPLWQNTGNPGGIIDGRGIAFPGQHYYVAIPWSTGFGYWFKTPNDTSPIGTYVFNGGAGGPVIPSFTIGVNP